MASLFKCLCKKTETTELGVTSGEGVVNCVGQKTNITISSDSPNTEYTSKRFRQLGFTSNDGVPNDYNKVYGNVCVGNDPAKCKYQYVELVAKDDGKNLDGDRQWLVTGISRVKHESETPPLTKIDVSYCV